MDLHIGKLIKTIARKRGISQVELAKLINTSKQNIQNIFMRSSIDTNLLIKLSLALNYNFFSEFNVFSKSKQLNYNEVDFEIKKIELSLKNISNEIESIKDITKTK